MAAGRTLHNAYLLAPGLLHRVRQRRALHHAEAHLQHLLLQMLASQHARGLWYVAAHGFVAADESFLRQSSTTLLPRSIEPLVWAAWWTPLLLPEILAPISRLLSCTYLSARPPHARVQPR